MTKKQAMKLYQTKWWKKKTAVEIVRFQLFERRLCMPWILFRQAMEKVLRRPVYPEEFGLNTEGLQAEFNRNYSRPRHAPSAQRG